MSSLLKIVLIFVLFVGSITTVALLAGPEPSPSPPSEPLVFDDLPTEPPPTIEPQPPTEPPPPPPRATTTRPAAVTEPEETPPRRAGSGSVTHESGAFSEGGRCGGTTEAKGGTVDVDEDDEEDC